MIRCVVVRNPASRRRLSAARMGEALDAARAAGWHVDVVVTARDGDGTELARRARDSGADVIIVDGGDGTINEVINGIAGSRVALAVLAGGTANVWAREIRTSHDARRAIREIVGGVRRRVDLGRANGRYFLLMAGVGLDAAIVPRVAPRLKRWLGRVSYVLTGVITAFSTRPADARVRIDGEQHDTSLYWMLVGNTRSYGGLARITHRARVDDGQLDVAIMRRGGLPHLLADGVRLIFGRHDHSPNVEYRHATSIEVATPGLPVQVDGELAGTTPMTFTVAPLALEVIVPASLSSPLFGVADASVPAR
jgi:YegS/Rv2252/BmrU family lipid kinase